MVLKKFQDLLLNQMEFVPIQEIKYNNNPYQYAKLRVTFTHNMSLNVLFSYFNLLYLLYNKSLNVLFLE